MLLIFWKSLSISLCNNLLDCSLWLIISSKLHDYFCNKNPQWLNHSQPTIFLFRPNQIAIFLIKNNGDLLRLFILHVKKKIRINILITRKIFRWKTVNTLIFSNLNYEKLQSELISIPSKTTKKKNEKKNHVRPNVDLTTRTIQRNCVNR